jgi:SAM-dependent methyltransferase
MIKKIVPYINHKKSVKLLLPYFEEFLKQEACTTKRFSVKKENFYPQLKDNSNNTAFDRHYIYHPAWAARILKEINPSVHVDISSTVHFCSIVSAFIPIKFYDYRPAEIVLTNLSSEFQNLTELSFENDSIESLSCMHTIEHVGLGRYGDPLNYNGDLTAMKELARVLKPKGNLLFVVPVGNEAKIFFNAHRIYTKMQVVLHMKSFGLKLHEFSLIPDLPEDGGIVKSPSDDLLAKQNYGCGCFWFTKI